MDKKHMIKSILANTKIKQTS